MSRAVATLAFFFFFALPSRAEDLPANIQDAFDHVQCPPTYNLWDRDSENKATLENWKKQDAKWKADRAALLAKYPMLKSKPEHLAQWKECDQTIAKKIADLSKDVKADDAYRAKDNQRIAAEHAEEDAEDARLEKILSDVKKKVTGQRLALLNERGLPTNADDQMTADGVAKAVHWRYSQQNTEVREADVGGIKVKKARAQNCDTVYTFNKDKIVKKYNACD